MQRLPNELLAMISSHLGIFDARSFRNTCQLTLDAVPAPKSVGKVSDAIRPFFPNVEDFRHSCLQPHDCVIGGVVPFLTLAGLQVNESIVLDIFVTHCDALPLCKALCDIGCKFHLRPDAIAPPALILSSLLLYILLGTKFPPDLTEAVPAAEGFPASPCLGPTAHLPMSVDPVLASLTVLTPRHRWLRVHVMKTHRTISEAVYAMPSSELSVSNPCSLHKRAGRRRS